MQRSIILTVTAALLLPLAVTAQERMHHEEGFEHHLYPPELVMRHQQQLQLTEQQRTTIKEAVKQLQTQTLEFQWELQEQNQALSEMLARESVDSRQVHKLAVGYGVLPRLFLEAYAETTS